MDEQLSENILQKFKEDKERQYHPFTDQIADTNRNNSYEKMEPNNISFNNKSEDNFKGQFKNNNNKESFQFQNEKNQQQNLSMFRKIIYLLFQKELQVNQNINLQIYGFLGFGLFLLIFAIIVSVQNKSINKIVIAEDYFSNANINCEDVQQKQGKNHDSQQEQDQYQYDKAQILIDDSETISKNICWVEFQIQNTITKPLYLYYEIENYYQNDKFYTSSRSPKQLEGISITKEQAEKECFPIVYNKDLTFKPKMSYDNKPLDPEAIANPCGLIANSIFTDVFRIFKEDKKTEVIINQNDISWPGEKGIKYKKNQDGDQLQWINVENEHFINWMRTAGLPTFQKLWGKIDLKHNRFQQGEKYYLQIENNFDTQVFEGKKNVYLSTVGDIGGQHVSLEYFLYFISLGFWLAGLYFIKNKSLFQNAIQKEQSIQQKYKSQ